VPDVPLRLASLLVAGAFVAAGGWAAPIEQSISTSRQFIVYGTELSLRGAICDFAEGTKRELLTLLDQRDEWTTAIIINAQYPQANLPELPRLNIDVGQTGFGLKLQLDLMVNAEVSRPEFRRELLRALLLEMMYRGQPKIPAGSVYSEPPDWLLDGIPARQSDFSADQFCNFLGLPGVRNHILPLEKFLEQRPELLDAAGRTLYRAYSFALVDLLSHAPDGAHRLTRFVANLPAASDDAMAELGKHFPELSNGGAAEKIWQKQIVRLASGQPYQLLNSGETERRLAEKLRLKIFERGIEKKYRLEDFALFLRARPAKAALGMLAHDLGELATKANPIYAPIIGEYSVITACLLRGKTSGIAKRLAHLQTTRQEVAAQMREIDDYLNWFEATSLARPSGEFADYLQAAERATQPDRTKRDLISVYLDVLEAQVEN